MLSNPKISVIMSVYNGEKYLKEAIESILRQTFSDFEFIIIDDGSTDKSLNIIEDYNDDRIKVIKNDVNVGLTKNLNRALVIAKGEYVARQDADDISLLCRFEEQIKFYENNPELVLLGTSIYIMDEKGKIIKKRIAPSNPGKFLINVNNITHASVMFNKLIVNKLGGYNELFKYAQDYDLWLRISKYYSIMNLQLPLYCVRIHRNSIGTTKSREQFLYAILAKKFMMNKLKDDAFLRNLINRQGIKCIYQYLNKWEKLLFIEFCAYSILIGHLWKIGIGRVLLKIYNPYEKKSIYNNVRAALARK